MSTVNHSYPCPLCGSEDPITDENGEYFCDNSTLDTRTRERDFVCVKCGAGFISAIREVNGRKMWIETVYFPIDNGVPCGKPDCDLPYCGRNTGFGDFLNRTTQENREARAIEPSVGIPTICASGRCDRNIGTEPNLAF